MEAFLSFSVLGRPAGVDPLFQGGTDITAAVTAGTYQTPLIARGGVSPVYHIKIRPALGIAVGSTTEWAISFTSKTAPAVDAVRAGVTVG